MKIRPLLATAAALALALTACGNGDETPPTNGTTEPAGGGSAGGPGVDDGTTLTMWTRAPLEAQARNAVDAYNASHENQVQLEILPNDDVEGRVGAGVQTDSLPDLLAGDVVRVPYWVEQGVFADLTSQIQSLENLDQLQSGHIDAGTRDGAMHTLPFVTDISVMVWNKDLYEQAGLDPEQGPASVGEFLDQAKAVAGLGQDGVSGTYIGGQCGGCGVFTLFPMMWASGEEVLDEAGTTANVNSDVAKQVYDAYRELAGTQNGLGAGSAEETGATWTAPFQEGRVGVMQYPYTAVTGLFDTVDFEIGVAGIPGVDGGESTFLGGDALGVSRSSENIDQAWHFLSWLMTDEAQQEVFADNNDTASNLNVLENGYEGADERTLIANNTIQFGRTPVAVNFNEAFNAPGSNWVLLLQDAIWSDGSQIDSLNDAMTSTLGG